MHTQNSSIDEHTKAKQTLCRTFSSTENCASECAGVRVIIPCTHTNTETKCEIVYQVHAADDAGNEATTSWSRQTGRTRNKRTVGLQLFQSCDGVV